MLVLCIIWWPISAFSLATITAWLCNKLEKQKKDFSISLTLYFARFSQTFQVSGNPELPYLSFTFEIGSSINIIAIEDRPGQYQSGSSSIVIMSIENAILKQGERYAIEDGHGWYRLGLSSFDIIMIEDRPCWYRPGGSIIMLIVI